MTLIPYTPNADCTQTEMPPVRKVKFGNGFEQVSQSVMQPITRKWTATFSNFDTNGVNNFLGVLRSTNGVTPVQWQSPEDDEPLDYLVTDWQTKAMAGKVYEVTVNLESFISFLPPVPNPTPACVEGPEQIFDLVLESSDQDTPRESTIASIDSTTIKGNILPVFAFNLDDFLFVVPADYDVAASYSLIGTIRQIIIPPYGFLVYDGNDPELAAGIVNDPLTTRYIYQGNGSFITIPGLPDITNLSDWLAELIRIGVPNFAHNKIAMSSLNLPAYKKGNLIEFKLMHIAHGAGHARLGIKIPSCNPEPPPPDPEPPGS